jgi:hypothetical protein
MHLPDMSKYRSSETLDDRYPARRLLDLIVDKWTPIVLYCLSGGVRRFNEMHRQIPDISKGLREDKPAAEVRREVPHPKPGEPK